MPFQYLQTQRGGGARLASERVSPGQGQAIKVLPVWGGSGSVSNFPTGNIQVSLPSWVSKNVRGVISQASGVSGLPASITPAQAFVTAPAGAAGQTTQIVAAQAGRIIIVCFVLLQADSALSYKFVSGGADISPSFTLAAGESFNAYCEYGVLIGTTSNDLSVTVTAASGNLKVLMTYFR
ncbi:MAG: hypothetical protein V2G41_09985 [bacterium JZ-2024 1]